jgi:hypothetical protein
VIPLTFSEQQQTITVPSVNFQLDENDGATYMISRSVVFLHPFHVHCFIVTLILVPALKRTQVLNVILLPHSALVSIQANLCSK